MTLEIQAIDLHWIDGSEPERDLCAHGGVRVIYSGDVIVTDEELALSTGAVHLLRTIKEDHTPQLPLFEHMIPHCGHFMFVEPGTGVITNIGCNAGLNWWVRSGNSLIVLTFDDRTIELPRAGWEQAVAGFSDSVESFFKRSDSKRPYQDDLEWWLPFLTEWNTLRASIVNLPPN